MMEQDRQIADVIAKEQSGLRSFIRRRVSNDADADDLLQEVFFELVRAHRLLLPIDFVTGWLYRVARNRITDLFRKRRLLAFSEASQQTDEVENLKLAWSRRPPEGCRLPKFNSFEVNDELVVVMELVRGVTLFEYCSGERSALYDLMHDIERAYRLLDVHDENVMVDEDGILVPVDFGC